MHSTGRQSKSSGRKRVCAKGLHHYKPQKRMIKKDNKTILTEEPVCIYCGTALFKSI